jgi:outer membrane protein assembly factor BamB
MISRILTLFFIFIAHIHLFGQLTENYFHDNEGKEFGKINFTKRHGNFLYISANLYDSYYDQPYIIKLSLDGEIIWKTTTAESFQGYSAVIQAILITEDYLFGYSSNAIWKFNIETGLLEWKKPLDSSYGLGYTESIIDYDENTFLLRVHLRPDATKSKILFINKTDGHVSKTYPENSITEKYISLLAVDLDKNIYYVREDSLFKISPQSLLIWKNSHQIPTKKSYGHIYIDSTNNVFLFGHKTDFFHQSIVDHFDKNTGSFLWNFKSNLIDEVSYSASVDDGENIYVTWEHIYYGSGPFFMQTQKLKKSTGEVIWESSLSFDEKKSEQAALAMDLDGDGNLLLTGYYGYTNNAGNWALLKLDGRTGVDLLKLTIRDSDLSNEISKGTDVYWYNGKICLFGMMQSSSRRNTGATPLFMQIDPVTSQIVKKKYFWGNNEFSSQTIKIEQFGNKKVIMKQIGRYISVSVYQDEDLLWEKLILEDYRLLGYTLNITSSNNIVVTGFETWDRPTNKRTQFIHVYTLNPGGTIIGHSKFESYQLGSIHLETLCVGDQIFVLYKPKVDGYDQMLRLRKIENGVLSNEVNLNVINSVKLFPYQREIEFQTRKMIPWTDTHILIPGLISGVASVLLKVNRTTLAFEIIKISSITLHIQTINVIHKLNDHELLIGGSGATFSSDQIARFNLNTLAKTWSQSYHKKSEIYKYVFDADSSHIYTIGVKGDSTAVRKIRLTDGVAEWSYYQVSPDTTYQDVPVDIDIDHEEGLLTLVGSTRFKDYWYGEKTNSIFISTLTTKGELIKVLRRDGEIGYDNIAKTVRFFPANDSWLIGGNLNLNGHPNGFVYGLNVSNCIIAINPTLKQVENHLAVEQADAQYQWINCSTNTPIEGAVNQTFEPSESGEFAVRITKANCEKISECYLFTLPLDCSQNANPIVQQVENHLAVEQADAQYQWINCSTNTPIEGAVNQTFEPSESGEFAVRITKANCEKISECYVFTLPVTGTENNEHHFEVFPNPTTGIININFSQNTSKASVVLINSIGKQVIEQKWSGYLSQTELDIKTLHSGLYLLIISTHSSVQTFKIRKE